MRILVTGSRDWHDRTSIARPLMKIITETCPMIYDDKGHPDRVDTSDVVIVHGGARGADLLAEEWASGTHPLIRCEAHPVTAEEWRTVGKGAGYKRNAEMVNLGADVCIAFINPCHKDDCKILEVHGSHGATHTADLAESRGIRTIRIRRFSDATT